MEIQKKMSGAKIQFRSSNFSLLLKAAKAFAVQQQLRMCKQKQLLPRVLIVIWLKLSFIQQQREQRVLYN